MSNNNLNLCDTNDYVQSWQDARLTWSAEEYGGLGMIRLPADLVWTPDMVQYNK